MLSLSPGPAPLERAEHLKRYANMWRITDDFWDDWRLLKAMFERAEKWCIHAGPGHWPDADMLPVGALRQCYDQHPDGKWTKFTRAEQRTMMTLWCMLRSPLMIGGELSMNDDFTLELLTNAELMEIERATHCAHPLYTNDEECVWIAPRTDGEGLYIAAFNLSDAPREIRVEGQRYLRAKELWRGGTAENGLITALEPHDAAVWRLYQD